MRALAGSAPLHFRATDVFGASTSTGVAMPTLVPGAEATGPQLGEACAGERRRDGRRKTAGAVTVHRLRRSGDCFENVTDTVPMGSAATL